MNVLSFYLGIHDSNAVLFELDTGKLRYVKSERLLGIKRHCADLGFLQRVCAMYNFRPDIVAFSDGNRNHLGSGSKTEPVLALSRPPTSLFHGARWFNVDHHLAHVLSAWPLIDSECVDVGIAIDGRGDHDRRVSVFRIPANLSAPVVHNCDHRIGHLFDLLGQRMGLGGHLADHAGKIMGLQSYGTADQDSVAKIVRSGFAKDVFRIVLDAEERLGIEFFNVESQRFRDWLATVHTACLRLVEEVFTDAVTSSNTITFSGGCALNSVFNAALQPRYPKMHIPPHAYDGGLSLGILEAVRLAERWPTFTVPAFPFIQSDEDFGFAGASTVQATADLLASGKVVGWIQGHGEIGPRALGHRSLLLDPSMTNGKDVMNNVKRREPWRPFAPSILPSEKAAYFADRYAMEFMLHAATVSAKGATDLAACVHVDGTSRVQTVDASKQPLLASYEALIEAFRDRTGIGAVMNTSYNAGGKPIVSTREEAILLFRNSAIDALVLGDELLVKP